MTRPANVALTVAALAAATALACASDTRDTPAAAAGTGGAQTTSGGTGSGASAGNSGTAAGGTSAAGGDDSGSPGEAGSPGGEPYAHVVAVSARGSDQSYQFAVSIESSDIDCSQFANWWEVLTEDGTLLYRRILEHSHTDENGTTDPDRPGNTFTRSGGPVPVSGDTPVIVRAHMSTGGYNGRSMRGTPEGDFVEAPDLDSTFALNVESEAPQPSGCDF